MPAVSPVLTVRAVHNHVYCPRLFYYQVVEDIFVEDHQTVSGSSMHRQVDKPSFQDADSPWTEVEIPEGSSIRSLAIDSDTLGLSGKVDIIEGGPDGVSVIDYKRGSPHRLQDGTPIPKDADSVQVAAYVEMLRENGTGVSRAFVYYASEKIRVPVELTDELFNRFHKHLNAAREVAESGVCPPPLVDDPRCLYCSAYPVCLPGESHFWAGCVTEPPILQPPYPDRNEGQTLIVSDYRAHVGKSGDSVIVTKEKGTIAKIPVTQLRAIYLFGAIQISTQLLHSLLESGIDVSYFTPAGRFLGITRGLLPSGVDARLGQYRLFQEHAPRLMLSKEIVRGKITNSRTLLMRNGNPSDAILNQMTRLRDNVAEAENQNVLLGIEGQAASLYFSAFSSMLKKPDLFDFNRRNRRPPRDPVNSLLSLGYSMMAKELTGVCHSVGLDPFLGFYHQPRYGKPALALDLMEEFRPLIADSVAISMLNRGELDPSDFISTSSGCNLNDQGRRAYFQAWFRRFETEVTHPLFGYRMCYRRMLEVQARQLWRFVRGEAKSYTAFTTR